MIHAMKITIWPIAIVLNLLLNCAYFISDYRSERQKINNPICSIHNCEMKTKICHLQYGSVCLAEFLYMPDEFKKKIEYDSMYSRGMHTIFPNAYISNTVKAGCQEKSQKWAKIYYCEKCNIAKKKWLKENEQLKPFPAYRKEEILPKY